ncbi:MAG: hypothetical protein ACI9YL_001981 [Luteibaculaceae bacterium]|jgi:hypothetical protein
MPRHRKISINGPWTFCWSKISAGLFFEFVPLIPTLVEHFFTAIGLNSEVNFLSVAITVCLSFVVSLNYCPVF